MLMLVVFFFCFEPNLSIYFTEVAEVILSSYLRGIGKERDAYLPDPILTSTVLL